MEFIFYGEGTQSLKVPESIWGDFVQIHKESDEWNYWNGASRIPVFYLLKKGKIELHSLGMSQMYRLAYDNSIHDAIRNSSPAHLEEPGVETGYDFADLLFGAINSTQQDDALRGRVSCDMARLIDTDKHPTPYSATILNGPKPGYYPNYIRQPVRETVKLQGKHYNTLMQKNALLRGFKRYPARSREKTGVQALSREQRGRTNVQVELHTLPQGSRFEGRIVFHNLRAVELGALLWVMTWGENNSSRHGLGMGKPFGFGQVRFKPDWSKSHLIPNDPQNNRSLDSDSAKQYIDKFIEHMESACAKQGGGWFNSPQIANLRAMADPEAADKLPDGMGLRHMCLEPKQNKNEFLWARQQAKIRRQVVREDVFVLADYAEATGRYADAASPVTGDSLPTAVPGNAGQEAGFNNDPSGQWLSKTFKMLREQDHIADNESGNIQIWKGKKLAQEWENIENEDLKIQVKADICGYWQAQGWWDTPPKGAARKARPLYGE